MASTPTRSRSPSRSGSSRAGTARPSARGSGTARSGSRGTAARSASYRGGASRSGASARRTSGSRGSTTRRRRRKKNSANAAAMGLILLMCVLCVIGGVMLANLRAEKKEIRQALNRTTFFDGIYIQDVSVGGMTYDQAKTTLERVLNQQDFDGSIVVVYGDKIWEANKDNLSLSFNLDDVLTQAYAIGRSASDEKENYEIIQQLKMLPKHFTVSTQLGEEGISALVAEIAQEVDKPAKNAAFKGFDNGVQFSPEETGLAVDQAVLAERILAQIQSGDFTNTVEVPTRVVEPEVTVAQLEASYRRLSRYTSTATTDSNRNNNIKLALSAINGTVLAPGAGFSFNDTTGERNDAKGYKPAGTILKGVLVQELGGGVCQVSTALFNAVVRADLNVTSRNPHTWPSNYVEIGQDAMVDYPGSDFKFTNNTSGDLYICCWFEDSTHTIYVELYGVPILEDGVSIKLRSETLETIPQPDDIIRESNALPKGTVEDTRTGRTGYRVRCYKQYVKDGEVIKEERLCDSYYAALAAIFTVGTGEEPAQTSAPSGSQPLG